MLEAKTGELSCTSLRRIHAVQYMSRGHPEKVPDGTYTRPGRRAPDCQPWPDHRTDGAPHPRSIGTSHASLVSKLRLTVYSTPFYALSSSLILIPLSRGLGIEKKNSWQRMANLPVHRAGLDLPCVAPSGIVELEIDGWMDGQSATLKCQNPRFPARGAPVISFVG